MTTATALTSLPPADYAVMQTEGTEIAEILREAAGTSGINPQTDLDRAKIPAGGGKTWSIPTLDGDLMEKEIVGVIVHHQDGRAWWEIPYDDSGGGSPPDCVSHDGVTGVGAPGGQCLTCALAQFGSDRKGRGQACTAIKGLYVMRQTGFMPLALALPPSSLRGVKKYLLQLASHGLRPYAVVTAIALEQDKNEDGILYSRATFRMVERLEPEIAERFKQFAETLKPALGVMDVGATMDEVHHQTRNDEDDNDGIPLGAEEQMTAA